MLLVVFIYVFTNLHYNFMSAHFIVTRNQPNESTRFLKSIKFCPL